MASLICPHCGATLPSQRTWAQTAVSTLIAAPAVPDMATQVRCDTCGRVSAASDLRHVAADRFKPSRLLPWLAAAALLIWGLTTWLAR
ncbi:MAG: hypothetical protein KF891_19855 [Rhizobacter sp.]|nr:hypothetical protein [Rhizobacter sp.]